jgi:hypothetical protein
MNAFGGQEWKPLSEIKSGLSSKIGHSAHTGAIVFAPAFFQNQSKQFMVFSHGIDFKKFID